jgi:2-oxoglutarate ferredoxin oxidoreductase subunit beta
VKAAFGYPASLTPEPFPYCPGCGHGIVHRLLAEVVDDLGVRESLVCVTSIGCSVRAWRNFDFDTCQGSHGRALAVATGLKRCLPDKVIITYQGDGDLVAIGLAETVHAAARGEAVTVVFVNNAVFGATGGQAAPTTLPGQRTSTTPSGRDPLSSGYPIKMAELIAGVVHRGYVARVACDTAAHVAGAKRSICKAFEAQTLHGCFGLVEILAMCPTCWRLSPIEAAAWIGHSLIPHYPLGEFRVVE